jgi:hypothetical protein
MTRLLLIIIFSLSLCSVSGQSSDTIYYSQRDKVTWDDFITIQVDTAKLIMADLATTIQMKTTKVNVWTGVASFDVVAVAFKNRSWVTNNGKTDNELRHQQLYFDISEVIARRLKADINSKKINAGRQKKITETFQSYDKMLFEMHKSYDNDTRFGTDLEKQTEWEKKIWLELGKN